MILYSLIATAMIADLITFALVVPCVGVGAEVNPIMRMGYEQYNILYVAGLKIAALVAITLLVSRVSPNRRKLAASVGILIALVGVFGNTTAWISTW